MPDSIETLLNSGRFAEAAQAAMKSLVQAPDDQKLLSQLGFALLQSGQNEEAANALLKLIALRPDDAVTRYNCGLAFERAGRLDEAIALYKAALARKPAYSAARSNLAALLSKAKELEEAEQICREGLALAPSPELHCALGNVLNSMGRMKEALAEYDTAHASDSRPSIAWTNSLMASICLDDMGEEELFARHRAWGEAAESIEYAPPPKQPLAGRRLRIGYLSADFRRHSVAFFIEPLLACHDKSRVETFCYFDDERRDPITCRIESLADNWRKVAGKSDEALASLIRNDQLDILFDLCGHTTRRVSIFALRPAPIQIAWLGYPATTGLESIDFRITDAFADPPGTDAFHSEKLLRLPGHFLVFSPPDDAPALRPAPCLANGFVNFGSFNALRKITPSCIKLWALTLKAVPSSRLLLKNDALSNSGVRERLRRDFAAEGIAAKRLSFMPYEKSFASHLDAYSQVDIALDSFPYNGTTTTCEAMWMGVPTISLAGKAHRARVGLSLLSSVGLGSLAAETPEGFANIAKALSSNLPQLAAFKASLRNAMAASPLCDAKSFAEKFEEALFSCKFS